VNKELIGGWGRTPLVMTSVVRPDKAQLSELISRTSRLTPRGSGRGYGDCAVSADGVTVVSDLLKNIGTIEDGRVVVDAGVDLDELLRHVVPRGWFVPVTPGTKFVTIGGAIAADIHGKNHHRDGSFGEHIDWIEIMLADGTVVTVSPHDGADIFWATIGGMGLTGFVLRASVRLIPIRTSRIHVLTTRHNDLEDLMTAMMERDQTHHYTVAWVDTLATGRRLGRSVLWAGDHADKSALKGRHARDPLHFAPRQRINVPEKPQFNLVKPASVRIFNEFWFRKTSRRPSTSVQSIDQFFYPLDGVGNWNRLYGQDGFVQYQFSVPDERSELVQRFLDLLSVRRVPAFLSVLKRFGKESGGWISFPSPGWTLAVDIPTSAEGIGPLLDGFDEEVADAGGRVYFAKDSRLRRSVVATMYPRLSQFQELRRMIDPESRFSSHLSRRLGL